MLIRNEWIGANQSGVVRSLPSEQRVAESYETEVSLTANLSKNSEDE